MTTLTCRQHPLMVKEGSSWKYVFAYSSDRGGLITMEATPQNRKKALNAGHALSYFEKRFGNHEFKAGEKCRVK